MRIFIAMLFGAASLSAANLAPDHIREAASKAAALLQKGQKDWYAKQSCESCHNQILPAIAFRAARDHGVPLNEAAAHEDAARGFGPFASLDRAAQYNYLIDPTLDDAFRLMGMDAAGLKPNITAAVYARMIAVRQRADGHWVTIDQRPPQSYSYISATAIAIRGLQLFHHASLAGDTATRIARARTWLAAQTPRDTEERSYQLFGLLWSGTTLSSAKSDPAKHAADLAATQEADGGWKSVKGRASDAYSTGEALVALHDAGGMPVSDPVWQRGLDFLLKTQQPDGSWHVVSRLHPPASVSPPYFESGLPYGHDQFISAAGASWALMALSEALPAMQHKPVELPEAEPTGVEPWVETVLFGSSADLRAMLDKKFDANSATREGSTALMLAMPDLEKANLLIERGANVNARSKTKYSTLLVAAQYPHSSATMRFLLDHGAEVRLPKASGAPLFGATALGLAVMSGNADMIPALLAKGDNLTDKFLQLGMFLGSPLVNAISFDDPETLAALLKAGLPVDMADDTGVTLLDTAVIGGRTNIARLLIAHRANVNAVDKNGMTPLLYAASIDFGDSEMVDLLIQSGASTKARTKENLTASDLARKYGQANLLAALQH